MLLKYEILYSICCYCSEYGPFINHDHGTVEKFSHLEYRDLKNCCLVLG